MTRPEQEQIPPWAARERASDLAWIAENLHVFWPMAESAFATHGRGALMIDTLVRVDSGGHPFGYFTQEQIEEFGGQDEMRMVAEYDPTWEFVSVLIKEANRISSYRVGLPDRRPDAKSRRHP